MILMQIVAGVAALIAARTIAKSGLAQGARHEATVPAAAVVTAEPTPTLAPEPTPAVHAPTFDEESCHEPLEAAPDVTVVSRTRRRRTQQAPNAENFSELLDSLDDSFAAMRVPPIRGTWLPKSEIRALHKIGAFVAHPWYLEDMPGEVRVDTSCLPTIAAAHMTPRRFDTIERYYPRFAFAIKERRLPAGVEQFPGTPYRFGLSYEMHQKEGDPDSQRMTWWLYCWVVVGRDGVVRAPSEMRPVQQVIRHRRNHPDTGRKSFFISHTWERPLLMEPEEKSAVEHERLMLQSFRQLLTWWTTRAQRWSVAVKKDGHRVTFSIQPEHTAAYFADRDKSVKAPDGTAKKIIHYVSAHTRSNGSKVRAHIRGLREFDWKGYHCIVTAPTFTGQVLTSMFDLAPEEDDGRALDRREMLDLEGCAAKLAEWEEADKRNKRTTGRRRVAQTAH